MKGILLALFFLMIQATSGQVPSYGSSKTMDIASWNLYWYGHPTYGSSDNLAQRAGVAEVIRNSRVEIWCFQEIVDSADLTQVLRESGTFGHIYSQYWQDQKMGIAWDASKWTLKSDSQLFPQQSASFANGRLPLFAQLISNDFLDTLSLINVHLKAHTGTEPKKLDAYLNRRASAQLLNSWQATYPNQPIIIAGDWNDDLDKSNYRDTTSPFHQVMDSTGAFLFEKESYAGAHSWYYGNSMIDHMWVNANMKGKFKPNSQKILPLDLYLNAYPTEVSDHFPIFASFYPQTPSNLHFTKEDFRLYPNPSGGLSYLDGLFPNDEVVVYSSLGLIRFEQRINQAGQTEITGLEAGSYILGIRRGEQVFYYRLVVNP